MLLDLAMIFSLAILWLIQDARKNGIPAWPYVIASAALGSLGFFPYIIHRELRAGSRPSDSAN
jgi:hypothetical protein